MSAERKIRACGYARVSSREQAEEGNSLEAQEERLRAYAKAQGWELGDNDLYIDPGVSGAVPFAERPFGGKALAAADGYDRLIVTKLDRFGRSAADVLASMDELAKRGCAFVSTTESVDTSTPTGRLLRGILASVAEFERDRIKERVSDGMRALARQGLWGGGPRPYGYRSQDKLLVPVEAERKIVERIFAEYVGGVTLTQVARDLQGEKVPTATGKPWRQGTVAAIVRNSVYIGQMRHKEETFPGQHERIIDAQTWDKAQALNASVKARPGRGRGRPPKGNHLFRGGMLRCGLCGEAMVPRTTRGFSDYYCNGHQQGGKDFCSMPGIKREKIDGQVLAYFERIGLDVEASRAQLAESRARKLAEIAALRQQADAELQAAEERLSRVERDYLNGDLSAPKWEQYEPRLTAERDAAEAEAKRLAKAQRKVEKNTELADAEQDVLERLTEIRRAVAGEVQDAEGIAAVRAALSRLFDGFALHPQVQGDEIALELTLTEAEAEALRSGEAEIIVEMENPPGVLDVGAEYLIALQVKPSVLEGYGEDFEPILRREPLYQAENNSTLGLPTLDLFAPIRIGVEA